MEASESEVDDTNERYIEAHLGTLKSSAKAAEETLTAILNKMKLAQYKLKLELEELSETELRSKPLLRAWLKKQGLPEDCSFQEFFQQFLQVHKEDHRLNLSSRSVCLNPDAVKLFGLKGKDVVLSMSDILERLPLLYH